MLRSSGSVEPVTIQAITHTYDPADQTLWVPRDQRPEPMDDSVPELQYGSRQNCGYRSLTPEAQAMLGYRPADESSNGPFIIGIIVTHLSRVSLAFDVRRLTHEEDGVTKLNCCLYQFLANSQKYYWMGKGKDVLETLQHSLHAENVPPMDIYPISDILDEFGMLHTAYLIGQPKEVHPNNAGETLSLLLFGEIRRTRPE